jgi:hypothetical protein
MNLCYCGKNDSKKTEANNTPNRKETNDAILENNSPEQ